MEGLGLGHASLTCLSHDLLPHTFPEVKHGSGAGGSCHYLLSLRFQQPRDLGHPFPPTDYSSHPAYPRCPSGHAPEMQPCPCREQDPSGSRSGRNRDLPPSASVPLPHSPQLEPPTLSFSMAQHATAQRSLPLTKAPKPMLSPNCGSGNIKVGVRDGEMNIQFLTSTPSLPNPPILPTCSYLHLQRSARHPAALNRALSLPAGECGIHLLPAGLGSRKPGVSVGTVPSPTNLR